MDYHIDFEQFYGLPKDKITEKLDHHINESDRSAVVKVLKELGILSPNYDFVVEIVGMGFRRQSMMRDEDL